MDPDPSEDADAPAADRPERRVLVPTFGSVPDRAVEIALSVAAATDAELLVLPFEGDGSGDEPDDALGEEAEPAAASDDRTVPETVRERADDWNVDAREVRPGDAGPVGGVVAAADDHGAGLVVVDEESASAPGGSIRENAARRISEGTPCDAVVVSDNREPAAIASVLVPVADGDHAGTAVAVAAAIARATDAWIELLHVVESGDERERAERLLDRHAARVEDVPVERWILEDESVADVIVEQSEYYDLTVIGAPESNRLTRLVFGSVPNAVREKAANTVLTARLGDRGLFGGE